MPPETAVAVREDQHPIIAKIDAKMPEIAGMLPEGMRPDRFRKVVVQALLRNPDLWACTPVSVVTAITEAAEVGIEPTGVLGKGWLLPYNSKQPDGSWAKEAKFIPGWRGFVDLCWRADRLLLTPELVREGDEFSYQRGTGAFLHHVPILDDPDREKDDSNVTFAYVIVRFPDGREDFEVMSRTAIERIADRAKRKNPVWESDWGEMAKKTPIRRIAKRLPLSPALQRILAGDEAADFDTPVERVPDPKRAGLRDRISQRTAAIRGEPIHEPEQDSESPDAGGAPASPRKGDPWMARIHAIGAERGYDHDDLHDWAVQHFGVTSITELTISQRADFTELVERANVIGEPDEVPA